MPNRGQFAPGNRGGKKGRSGRKSKAEELGLQKLLKDCWTERDRRACIRQLAKDCKSDDFSERHQSRQLLLGYAFGRPKVQAEIKSDTFDWDNADLSILNLYELNRIAAGDDPAIVFAAARARRIREEAKAGGESKAS